MQPFFAGLMSNSLPPHLLEILVCPVCKTSMRWDRVAEELICSVDKLAYPVVDGVPHLLPDVARSLVETAATDSSPDSATFQQHYQAKQPHTGTASSNRD